LKFGRPKPAPHRSGTVGMATEPRQDRVMTSLVGLSDVAFGA
jgi:hypothetical protein